VYGENVLRKIVPIDSHQFGRVMAVCVGAMMVGSIQTTVEEGESVQRGQEFGYLAFGMILPFLSSIFLNFHLCNPKVDPVIPLLSFDETPLRRSTSSKRSAMYLSSGPDLKPAPQLPSIVSNSWIIL
jgi:Phosphatidylserine decarboxylase